MRLLRLGNSYDTDPNIATESNKASVADRILSAGAGDPVDTTIRVIWPSPGLPDLVDSWLERYQPDLVLLVVSSYWFTYVSVPLKVERTLGKLGKPLARAGVKAAETPWLSHNSAFRFARRAAMAAVGGTTNFTPEQVVESVEACIRRIVAREGIGLAVRGPRVAFSADGTEKTRRWAEARRAAVDLEISEFCRRLHIEYVGYSLGASPLDRPDTFQGDLVHATAEAHEEQGTQEGEALLRSWQALHAPGA